MQQLNVFYLASYELILSFISCLLTIYLATKFLNKFVLSKPIEWFIKEKHESGCLICGAMVFSVLYLIQGSIKHSTSALQSLLLSHGNYSASIVGVAIIHFIVFYGITFISAFGAIFVVSKIYRRMMAAIDFDHEIEIKKSMALSIFLTFIALSVVMFLAPAMDNFLGSLVNHQMLESL